MIFLFPILCENLRKKSVPPLGETPITIFTRLRNTETRAKKKRITAGDSQDKEKNCF